MTLCIHCGYESEDEKFCDSCGKMISETNEVEEINYGGYREISIPCVSRLSNMKESDIEYRDFKLIETPISVIKSTSEEYENELCFIKNDDVSLEEYLEINNLSKNDVSTILYRVYCIMSELQEVGYVLGSIDLCDLWIKDNNLSTIYYRQVRKFLNAGRDLAEIELGEIAGIPIKDKYNDIDKRMDVTLLGKLFMKLATEMKYEFEGYFHERYVAYNMPLFSNIVEKEMNIWLEKTINMDEDKLYPDIDKCIEEFNWLQAPKCLDYEVSNKLLNVEVVQGTDVGIGKNEKMKKVPESERNEDSVLVEEVIEVIDGREVTTKALFLVADGVSNADIGTGKKASNILKDVTARLWNEMFDDINDIQSVQEFVDTVIRESNERIWEYVSDVIGEDIGLQKPMATTMSIAIKIKNKLYYTSLGDSPIMLLNDNGFIPLTFEDNQGNESLVKGCGWSKFSSMDSASSLTKCIGGKFSIPGNENKANAKVSEMSIVEDEMLVICSDGLTDYVCVGLDIDAEWEKKEVLEDILREETFLDEKVEKLIDEANLNGGGDNISVILARFNY